MGGTGVFLWGQPFVYALGIKILIKERIVKLRSRIRTPNKANFS